MSEAQGGKGLVRSSCSSVWCHRLDKQPCECLRNLTPSDLPGLMKGVGLGHLWHLWVPGTSCPVPQVPSSICSGISFNLPAFQPARVSSSSLFLQRSPLASIQLDASEGLPSTLRSLCSSEAAFITSFILYPVSFLSPHWSLYLWLGHSAKNHLVYQALQVLF